MTYYILASSINKNIHNYISFTLEKNSNTTIESCNNDIEDTKKSLCDKQATTDDEKINDNKNNIKKHDYNEFNTYNNFISNSLYNNLCKFKKQIEDNYEYWDNIKKFTNPYEFIHTTIPSHKVSVSKLKPLSRSFYKMIEMIKIFNFFNIKKSNTYLNKNNIDSTDIPFIESKITTECEKISPPLSPTNSNSCNIETKNEYYNDTYKEKLVSFHLAEGPGGFIEALTYLRKNSSDIYYGMTLVNDDPNCPGWRKSKVFLENNPNVSIIYGADNTGNLLSMDNLEYCISNYKNKIDIITADGGIDVSNDFNKQEQLVCSLIIAEVLYAIIMQKKGGHFILKVFDIFSKTTVDLLYILTALYGEVYIMKPCTSRIANSEKYIVCKNFLLDDSKEISEVFKREFIKICSQSNDNIISLLTIPHDYYFINRIEEINAILGQQQIENIITTINTITNKHSNEKIENMKKTNIQKAINWCEKYDIPYNKIYNSNNIFLTNSTSWNNKQNNDIEI